MLRFVLALSLGCAALHSACQSAEAADKLSACLDASTVILAGGDVSDKELTAAQSACARLKQTTQDEKTLARINFAADSLASEAKLRQSKH